MTNPKKIKTVSPKEMWQFFTKSVSSEGEAVFLLPELTGLCAATTSDLSRPPDTVTHDTVSRGALVVVLKILVALKGGRPVKLIPAADESWAVFYGPKS